jgi:hypothetical protein
VANSGGQHEFWPESATARRGWSPARGNGLPGPTRYADGNDYREGNCARPTTVSSVQRADGKSDRRAEKSRRITLILRWNNSGRSRRVKAKRLRMRKGVEGGWHPASLRPKVVEKSNLGAACEKIPRRIPAREPAESTGTLKSYGSASCTRIIVKTSTTGRFLAELLESCRRAVRSSGLSPDGATPAAATPVAVSREKT